MSVLYHGSVAPEIKVLKPRRQSTPTGEVNSPDAVYGSDDPAYALAHAFRPSDLGNVEICYRGSWNDGKPNWGPCRVELPASLVPELDVPVSLYTVASDDMEYCPRIPPEGRNFRSLQEIKVLEELRYPNLRVAIEQHGGTIVVKD